MTDLRIDYESPEYLIAEGITSNDRERMSKLDRERQQSESYDYTSLQRLVWTEFTMFRKQLKEKELIYNVTIEKALEKFKEDIAKYYGEKGKEHLNSAWERAIGINNSHYPWDKAKLQSIERALIEILEWEGVLV